MKRDEVPLVVAPSGSSQAVFSARDGELRQLSVLPKWPAKERVVASPDGWISCRLSPETILVARLGATHQLATETRLAVPEGVSVETLAFTNGLLFAGGTRRQGYSRGPWIGCVDLNRSSTWQEVQINGPKDSSWLGKGIDALASAGTHLVAFDNILEPLFALLIGTHPGELAPVHESTIGLEPYTTYERVVDAASSARFVAYLSRGINHGISSQFVSVFSGLALDNASCVFSESHNPFEEFRSTKSRAQHHDKPVTMPTWKQLAVDNSYALVAAGRAGLGVGDIAQCDGIAYLPTTGPVDQLRSLGSDGLVIVSSESDGHWTSRLVLVSERDLHERQRLSLAAYHPNLEQVLRKYFNLRMKLTCVELLRKKLVPAERIAVIADGAFRLGDGSRSQVRSASYFWDEVRVSVALRNAGIETDIARLEPLSFSLRDYSIEQLDQAFLRIAEAFDHHLRRPAESSDGTPAE